MEEVFSSHKNKHNVTSWNRFFFLDFLSLVQLFSLFFLFIMSIEYLLFELIDMSRRYLPKYKLLYWFYWPPISNLFIWFDWYFWTRNFLSTNRKYNLHVIVDLTKMVVLLKKSFIIVRKIVSVTSLALEVFLASVSDNIKVSNSSKWYCYF